MVLNRSSDIIQPLAGLVSLDRLPVGQPAIVRELNGEGTELLRLRVMGLCLGQGVHTLRAGRRMIVCVAGTRIGMTSEVARSISVEPLEAREPATRSDQE